MERDDVAFDRDAAAGRNDECREEPVASFGPAGFPATGALELALPAPVTIDRSPREDGWIGFRFRALAPRHAYWKVTAAVVEAGAPIQASGEGQSGEAWGFSDDQNHSLGSTARPRVTVTKLV